MNIISPLNPVIYSSVDGISLPPSKIVESKTAMSVSKNLSSDPAFLAKIKKAKEIAKRGGVTKTVKGDGIRYSQPPTRGKGGIPKESIPLIPPSGKPPVKVESTETAVEETKTGFFSSLTSNQKIMFGIAVAVVGYFAYKKYFKKGGQK